MKGQVRESQFPGNLASIYTLRLDDLLENDAITERIMCDEDKGHVLNTYHVLGVFWELVPP